MLIKTHLAIVIFLILFLLPVVENDFIFISIALIATFLPDIDSGFSTIGRYKTFKLLQVFVKHRGLLHSFTFLIAITIFFTLFLPKIALPFFLGWGTHLFVDSFTVDGIRPFYPSKKTISGKIRTGGKTESIVLVLFVMGDLFMLVLRVSSLI